MRRSSNPSTSLLAAAGVVGAMLLVPAQARAASVQCGQVITNTSPEANRVTVVVELDADLTCAASDGLAIAGSDVLVDLKGHTIAGAPGFVGVHVRWGGPYTNVEIRNGTIRGFGQGVRLDTADDNHVWNLTLADNVKGVDVANANRNLIDKNRISGCAQDAVRLGGASKGNRVVQNTVSACAFGISAADDSSGNLISQNQISGCRAFGIASFGSGPAENVISRNVVTGSAEDGIRIQAGSVDTIVSQNKASSNGDDGIEVQAGTVGTVVTKNTATSNGDLGIQAVTVTDGDGNPAQCTGVTCSP